MHVKGDEERNTRMVEPRIKAGINRRRLTSMVELARIYGDLGVKEIADAVGRDKTSIIPPSGNPKLDMIDSLAGVLEWTVGDVVNALEGGSKNGRRAIHTRRLASGRRFGKLHLISKKLDRNGRWKWSRVVSGMLLLKAVNSRERSIALGMLGLSQMRGGDLRDALATLRKGLNEDGIRFETELEIKTLLCRTHLLLEHHLEAKSVANEILGSIEIHASKHRADFRDAERTARYVRGNSVRASIDQGIGVTDLREARSDLLISLQIPETTPEHDLDERSLSEA